MVLFNELIGKGYEPIKLKGKRPIDQKWPAMKILKSNWQGNIGIRCGEVYALDLDIYDEDLCEKVMNSALTRFGNAPVRIGLAPKILCVYKGVAGQKKIKRSWEDSKGQVHAIELLGSGQQFAAYGIHPETNKNYSWPEGDLWDKESLNILDFEDFTNWLDELDLPCKQVAKREDLGDFKGLIERDISKEEIQSMLSVLDNGMLYDDWIKVGMALHDWDADEGLNLWEKWSLGGRGYEAGATARRWKDGFGSDVTIGSLIYMSRKAEWVPFRKDLEECETETQVNALAVKVKASKVDAKERDILSKLFAKKLKKIIGVSVAIKDVRGMLTKSDIRPKWCLDWVRITAEGSWYNISDLTKHDSVGFNLLCSKYIDSDNAVNFVTTNGFIKTVNSIQYIPTSNDRIVMHEGREVLNTFMYESLPEAASTSGGVEKVVIEHLNHIMEATDADTMIKWMAWQVRHIGELLRWAPVIQGDEGVGKSFLGRLTDSVLGHANVGKVSPNSLNSNYNSWATGVAVNIVEELKLTGHNRYDIANALKPLITDKHIDINKKYASPYRAMNHANYLVFTNFKDAIPMIRGDRRWWPVFTKKPPKIKGYFNVLFDTLEKGSEIKAWLLSVDLTNFGKAPPHSDAKLMMIDTEESCYEGLSEARDLLEKGGYGYCEDVFVSDLFRDALSLGIGITNHELHILYKKLGYMKNPKRFKFEGKTRVLWSKSPISNISARKRLLSYD